jgi:HSP20 family molecular chaperone IbpA
MSNQDDPTGWMWIHACEVIVKAERLQRQFFQPSASQRSLAIWEPPVDVFEDEGEIVIVVAMPGVAAERVQVTHEAGTLVVRGVRPLSPSGSGHRLRQLEIPYGAFERRITLPNGRLEIGPPELDQGCLTLKLRKIDEAQP